MRLLKNMLSNNLEPTKHFSSALVFGERAVYLPMLLLQNTWKKDRAKGRKAEFHLRSLSLNKHPVAFLAVSDIVSKIKIFTRIYHVTLTKYASVICKGKKH